MRLSGPSPCPRAQGQASDRACAAPATSSSTPWANRPMRRPSCEKDRKSTRLNSSHLVISYAVFCLKKKTQPHADKLFRRKRLPCHLQRPKQGPRLSNRHAPQRPRYPLPPCKKICPPFLWIKPLSNT